MDLSEFILTIGFMFLMCWTPGPNTMLCAAHGNRHGWQGTLPLEAGMGVGFFTLGVIVGVGIEIVEEYRTALEVVKYVGTAYMLYLAYHIASALPAGDEAAPPVAEVPLGPSTGFMLQFVNPKGIAFFVLLMGVYAPRLGDAFAVKLLLAATTTAIGVGSVLFWSATGVLLKRVFSDPASARRVNLALGALLGLVALDIAFHEQLRALVPLG
jgi:threonine/homoserine/homoserine lactone efflux protein